MQLHLPLAVVDLLLQFLQVGQEGLVELRQTEVLLTTSQGSATAANRCTKQSHATGLNTAYLHKFHQLLLHTDDSNVLYVLIGAEESYDVD